jgi:hypothetical protein
MARLEQNMAANHCNSFLIYTPESAVPYLPHEKKRKMVMYPPVTRNEQWFYLSLGRSIFHQT